MRRVVHFLRKRQGLTQEQFAEKAGLDYKYYQLFETGHTGTPSLKMVESIARVLSVKPWVLFCDEIGLIEERTGVPAGEISKQRKPKPGRPRKLAE
ncbi:MAG: helix-turn-helix domain-containing protein [Opitutaceae bacterium]|nr:helix-turn-helix domain-containing protein [Opitutaceae bacterium]